MIPQHNSAMPIRNPANYGSAREAQSAGIVLAARGAWQRRGDRAGAAGLHIAAIAERRIDHDPRRPSVGWQRGAASHGPRAAAWPLRIACHRGIDPRGNATGLTRRWGGAGLGVVGNSDWRRWRSSRQHPRSMARRSTGRALVPVLVQCRLGHCWPCRCRLCPRWKESKSIVQASGPAPGQCRLGSNFRLSRPSLPRSTPRIRMKRRLRYPHCRRQRSRSCCRLRFAPLPVPCCLQERQR